jgi:ATP-binding cassette subfamily B (MDR/TAP) protein 1
VFGDLHVEHIRQWREQSFGPLAARYDLTLHFPLWHRSYEELLHEFVASGASAEITAAPFGNFGLTVRVGDRFGPAFVAGLSDAVDRFGANGEFHTCVSW